MSAPYADRAGFPRALLAAGLALSAALASAACQGLFGAQAAPPAAAAQRARGAELFARHCAICHGESGRGDGLARELLFPAPRDFGHARFRLVSARNGMPTQSDLVRTLTRGMPGTGMPSFAWMPQSDVTALAEQVLVLARDGLAERLLEDAHMNGRELSAELAHEQAARKLVPNAPLELPPPVNPTLDVLVRGQDLFERNCMACHGPDGRRSQLAPRWNADGDIDWPRDFTSGILRGGASYEALARRVLCGIPGTSMPAHAFAERSDLPALIAYVQRLIPPGNENRLVQLRSALLAPRVAKLPEDAAAAEWERAREQRLVLAPLTWHDEAPTELRVSALHDGRALELRLRWTDSSCDGLAARASPASDAAALAFSAEDAPPLFGMGNREHPVNLWHWKAFEAEQLASLLDRALPAPHRGGSQLDAPVYRPALGLYTPSLQAEVAQARGLEDVRRLQTSVEVVGVPHWHAGEWTLVLRRALAAAHPGEIPLAPGQSVQLCAALWNGSIGQSGGRKSISIWHVLQLER